jgi:hypothetical protein
VKRHVNKNLFSLLAVCGILRVEVQIAGGFFMRWFLVTVAAFVLAGCGNVEWFPENSTTGGATAPNAFTFAQKTGVTISTLVQSDSVLVTGTNSGGWAITVADGTTGAGSQYSISGGPFTSSPGTILPNQTLRLQHTSAATSSTVATTNVTVGTFTTTFQSVTAAQ